jgi:Na+/phosphate symporter
MVTAFAAGGLVDLVPALAVMLGANVGTTLIVQVLSFDVSRVSFLFILIGVFMFSAQRGYPHARSGTGGDRAWPDAHRASAPAFDDHPL